MRRRIHVAVHAVAGTALAVLLGACATEIAGNGASLADSTFNGTSGAPATAATTTRPPSSAPTTTVDPQQIINEYNSARDIACESATGAALTLNNAAAVAQTSSYYQSAWSSYRSQEQFIADVAACSGPARQNRLASECDDSPQIDLLNRNPDAAAGECVTLVFQIVQFDQGTGPCSFRAHFDTTQHEYSFDYRGDNAIVNFVTPCPQLDAVGQDDVLRMRVQIDGGLTYDTTIGGTATAVEFSSVGEAGVSILQDN